MKLGLNLVRALPVVDVYVRISTGELFLRNAPLLVGLKIGSWNLIQKLCLWNILIRPRIQRVRQGTPRAFASSFVRAFRRCQQGGTVVASASSDNSIKLWETYLQFSQLPTQPHTHAVQLCHSSCVSGEWWWRRSCCEEI